MTENSKICMDIVVNVSHDTCTLCHCWSIMPIHAQYIYIHIQLSDNMDRAQPSWKWARGYNVGPLRPVKTFVRQRSGGFFGQPALCGNTILRLSVISIIVIVLSLYKKQFLLGLHKTRNKIHKIFVKIYRFDRWKFSKI